jgi:hypothetical protein
MLGFSVGVWVLIAQWLGLYEKLGSGDPRVVVRDTSRQCDQARGFGGPHFCVSAAGLRPHARGATILLAPNPGAGAA